MDRVIPRNWYAVTAKPRHEKALAEELAHKCLEPLLPMRKGRRRCSDRVKTIERPLFSGYLLCRLSLPETLFILLTPGVRSPVSFGSEPAQIADAEIEEIRSMVSSSLPAKPRPYLNRGQQVVIRSGLLKGLEGRLAYAAGGWEGVVTVDLLARSAAVQVERNALEVGGHSVRAFLAQPPGAATSGSRP